MRLAVNHHFATPFLTNSLTVFLTRHHHSKSRRTAAAYSRRFSGSFSKKICVLLKSVETRHLSLEASRRKAKIRRNRANFRFSERELRLVRLIFCFAHLVKLIQSKYVVLTPA
jgi:hypothetical protein